MRNKLRKNRLNKGYTHQNMASLLNINRATYTNIELGNKNPSFILAKRIKELLDYQDDNLFDNSDVTK